MQVVNFPSIACLLTDKIFKVLLSHDSLKSPKHNFDYLYNNIDYDRLFNLHYDIVIVSYINHIIYKFQNYK